MRSIAVALTWEFWRKSELWILAAVMLMACVTLTMAHYGMSPPSSAAMIAKIHYRTIFYLFICVAFFTLRRLVQEFISPTILLVKATKMTVTNQQLGQYLKLLQHNYILQKLSHHMSTAPMT